MVFPVLKRRPMLKRLVGGLPVRFRWTIHNVIAHPLSEVLFQLGLVGMSDWVHDNSSPEV
jgi:hypothetical protein